MNKYISLITFVLMLVLPISVFAQGSQKGDQQGQQGQGVQQQDRVQDPTTHTGGTTEPQGNQVQNQNQARTLNQGEGSQLQVAVQHMEQLMSMGGLSAEVGQKIKAVAQEQIQAQTQIQNQLGKLKSKSRLMERLFGPDYSAIKNLKQHMEQNQLRIQQLTQLQNEVANQANKTQLQEAVQALINQNTALKEQVQAEEQVGSLFGWLVRLLNK